MKAVVKSNILPDNGIKMTLKDYYESLPKTTSPKTEFLKRVVDECGVSFGTAINWAKRGMPPADETDRNPRRRTVRLRVIKRWKTWNFTWRTVSCSVNIQTVA